MSIATTALLFSLIGWIPPGIGPPWGPPTIPDDPQAFAVIRPLKSCDTEDLFSYTFTPHDTGLIFADGFESGDLSRWVPGGFIPPSVEASATCPGMVFVLLDPAGLWNVIWNVKNGSRTLASGEFFERYDCQLQGSCDHNPFYDNYGLIFRDGFEGGNTERWKTN